MKKATKSAPAKLPIQEVANVKAVWPKVIFCLAVFAAAASTETIGKIAALWFPTMAFVALGMEHCIANMFFIPLGILTGTDPRYIALAEAGKAAALKADFYSFVAGNLVPVTIGNIIGGSVLVGMLYLAANIKKA